MDKLRFKYFTWPENPETFEIRTVREPVYEVAADHTLTYKGLGPMCREIRGKGVFQGENAYADFNALAVILPTGKAEELVHPVWGTMKAYLVELDLLQESRENYVAYRFVFREAGENGMIPPMNEDYR